MLVLCVFHSSDVFIILKCWHTSILMLSFPKKSTEISVKKRFCAVLFPAKIYRPATHPIILPSVSPDKILRLYCVGGIFFLGKPYLENFMSRPSVIPAFRPTPLQNRGRNFVRSKRRSTYTSSGTLYLFLRLNNSETTFGNAFWAQRWRARTVPWPQIFNSWKCCAPPGLHICNSCEFWCDLVGAYLPQTLPSNNKVHNCSMDWV